MRYHLATNSSLDQNINNGRKVTNFIYNHHLGACSSYEVENIHMVEIYLVLLLQNLPHILWSFQCLMEVKRELRQMFTRDKLLEPCHAKSSVGKEIASIILDDRLRCHYKYIMKVNEPFVKRFLSC